MRTADKQIADILVRYGEPFGGNVWRVQGTAVIYHKTLERIAAQAGIAFDPPVIVRAERDEAVILVTGRIGEHSAWTIGEALINTNYRVSGKQAAYVYAMAEKRGKDRVILKLIGLHGLVYSEEEAEEFNSKTQAPQEEGEPPPPPPPPADLRNVRDLHTNGKPYKRTRSQEISGEMLEALWRISGDRAVDRWLALDAVKRDLDALDQIDRERVLDLAEERRTAETVPPLEAAQ